MTYVVAQEESSAVVVHFAACKERRGELLGSYPTYLTAKKHAAEVAPTRSYDCPNCRPDTNQNTDESPLDAT